MAKLETELGEDLDSWRQEELIAGTLLILAAWGREREATEEAVFLQQAIAEFEQELPEVLLQADELALKEGPRTVLQERMLEVFGDFANLQLQEIGESEPAREATEPAEETRAFAEPGPAGAQPVQEAYLDLNTASLQELQSIPHIGPERAQEIIERRPLSDIDELQEIDGIGPQRLEDIREHVVVNTRN